MKTQQYLYLAARPYGVGGNEGRIGHSSRYTLVQAKVLAGQYAKTPPASPIPSSWPLKVRKQADVLPTGLPWNILGTVKFISLRSIIGGGGGLKE